MNLEARSSTRANLLADLLVVFEKNTLCVDYKITVLLDEKKNVNANLKV